MASLTSGRESCLCVRGIVRLIKVAEMATHAGGRCIHEIVVLVAGLAVERGVRAGQSEPRELQVVKLSSEPVVLAVTLLALNREVERHMTGIVCRLEILLVAAVAVRRHRIELAQCAILVAFVALHRGVSAD